MVGQIKNLNIFKSLKDANAIPSLTIIVGNPLQGKTTLAKEFCKIIDSSISPTIFKPLKDKNAIGVDELRGMLNEIENSDNSKTRIYIIEKFENMSREGQNILLKIFEEPPKNTYFIVEVSYIDLLLETIKSRGKIFNLIPYSKQELLEYNKDAKDYIDFVNTPEDINYWILENKKETDKRIKLFNKTIENVYNLILTDNVIEVQFNTLANITLDRQDYDSFYYNDFLKELNKYILKNYKWQTLNQKFLFYNLVDKINQENRVLGIRKEDLVKRYIIDTYNLLRNNK